MFSPIRLVVDVFLGGALLDYSGDKWTVTPCYWGIPLLGLGRSQWHPTVLARGFLPRRLVRDLCHPQLFAGHPGSLGPAGGPTVRGHSVKFLRPVPGRWLALSWKEAQIISLGMRLALGSLLLAWGPGSTM